MRNYFLIGPAVLLFEKNQRSTLFSEVDHGVTGFEVLVCVVTYMFFFVFICLFVVL
jgi:hypothetical protein